MYDFYFKFLLVRAAMKSAMSSWYNVGVKKRILIAENARDMLEREKTILSSARFEVFTTTSGREALSIHREKKADLIIVSLDLEDISGDALCSLIRKNQDMKQVSIIITCNKEPTSLERVTHCGANAYITRPFHSEHLTKQVTRLLSIPQRQTYRVVMKISVRGKNSHDAFFCSSCDVSTTGMLIETEKPLLPGDRISCSFFLPGFGQITADGELTRVDTRFDIPRCGIRFRYLDSTFKDAIERFVAARSGKKH